MKDAIRGIVGKTVTGVVVREQDTAPRGQVFLLFSDGTYYELYSAFGPISGAGGVDRGDRDAIRAYMPEANVILEAYTGRALDPSDDMLWRSLVERFLDYAEDDPEGVREEATSAGVGPHLMPVIAAIARLDPARGMAALLRQGVDPRTLGREDVVLALLDVLAE